MELMSVKISAHAVYPRLRFEVFHNIQESIVDFWLITKAHLDLIQVAECILEEVSVAAGRQ